MKRHTVLITSIAVAVALACSLSIAGCAQREKTTAEDYAASKSDEQTEEVAAQAEETAEEQASETTADQAAADAEKNEATEAKTDTVAAAGAEAEAPADGAEAEDQAEEEKAPLLNTQMLMSSLSAGDKIVKGEIEAEEGVLDAIPDYEGDEYEALEAPAPSEIEDIAAAKAASNGYLWYTSGFAIIAPDHWAAIVGSDAIDFEGTKYDLVAYMQSWNKAECSVSAVNATDCHIANISNDGFYNIQYLDKGTITIDGTIRGSYAQFLADFDWKGTTDTYVIDINYIEGRTKLNYLGFMTPASEYATVKPDIDAVWNSLSYVSGEAF